MIKILSFGLAKTLKNKVARSVMLLYLFLIVSVGCMVYCSYQTHINAATKEQLTKLETATSSLSAQLSPSIHMELIKKSKGGILISSECKSYLSMHNTLRKNHEAMDLESEVYTMVLNEKNQFEFLVTSGETPYFKHVWEHPHEEHYSQYHNGATIGPYKDENGIWLSSFSPIKLNGKTIGIVQADKQFAPFIKAARSEFISNTILLGLLFMIMLFIIIKFINKQLKNDFEIQEILAEKSKALKFSNNELLSSLRVAKRLQEAVLPDIDSIRQDLPDFEVIYHPRDIVSGDFYWSQREGNHLYLAAGDCTGHGVPGAFMSMLASTTMNSVLNNHSENSLGNILLEMDKEVVRHFQNKNGNLTTDGMDVALCKLCFTSGMLHFSGAYRPLLLLRNGELTELSGDRSAIGGIAKDSPYKEHQIQLMPEDRIFLFTDGFVDQFGGDKGKKYMIKRLKSFLEETADHTLNEQKFLLDYEFHLWKQNLDQVDDVLLMCFEIPSHLTNEKMIQASAVA